MSVEIERKFLIPELPNLSGYASKYIAQGYLNSDPARTVRIRISDSDAFITVKGIGNETGVSRYEWEKPIDLNDARVMLAMCEKGKIEKTRYLVPCDRHVYEIDVFAGENEGLVIAEVELEREDEYFERPSWLGVEVTGDARYYNSSLSKFPFSTW